MTKIFDIAVIGGGLAGCSTALHARIKGASVVLLERGRCGTQASGVNYGGVRQQGRHSAELPLARRSRSIWSNLETLIGSDCEFTVTGHVKLARNDADMAELAVHRTVLRDHGIHAELLGASDIRRRFPYIGPGYAGASLCAEDGHANPRLVAPGFARAARALGADIREQSQVEAIHVLGDIFSVTLANDPAPVKARQLVNTAGAWGASIAALFGDCVNEAVMAPNMCVTEPIAPLIGPNLGVCGGGIYIRQTAHGSVIFGSGLGTADRDALSARPIADVTRDAAAAAIAMVPQLANVLLLRSWTGIEGRMDDGLPVVGPSPNTAGLFHAFGFSGHGFQLGPAVGAVLAELCIDGHSPTSLHGLSITRFNRAANTHV
ncbi:FAD-dependent oxidoreductase [Rhizobium sp. Root73]|uniref:NAD(P)/FAD-dependent oxidoreductase n=1 Tax=unclassified Rhizobium TaxID=2613769 RepID=UPI00072407C7|nr:MULTISPECIES: FAD-dependent oxidoreductase [unclassified Rhizobium]KQY15064.1 FAD-dependent oxidoreductase [Rhizobium sp. Root1334]KRC06496.1 FAD-dependent oxidoreductase [Rhizobium sp. Root73]